MARQLLRLAVAAALVFVGCTVSQGVMAWDTNMAETSEVQYSSADATELRNTAASLDSPVAIFEYVRNNYDYSLYHGARSGSVNTFLGGRGNDVDLAATLIAMLRSKGIPARYVVGTVRVPAAQVANWLQVEDTSLAKSLMVDQGLQKVQSTTSGSTPTIDFEHVWVEVLVPYGQYRGAGPQAPTCVGATPPSSCHWVPLDPSFKQYKQVNSGLDPYTFVNFDYTSYYNAIKNDDSARRDKNPLEIYQEQVLAWLRTNAPGKTLQDVPDFRGVVTATNGLLPASLPYAVVGAARTYNSMADHDAAVPATEPKKWGKSVGISIKLVAPLSGGGTLNIQVGGGVALLTDVVTKRLTVTTETSGGIPNMVVRLGGVEIARPISGNGTIAGYSPALGDPFTLAVNMDGVPAAVSGGSDNVINAEYPAMIGGYYLVATGGETSNWSQVHRAARQLLSANQQYAVVFNPAESGCIPASGLSCTPYVDSNGNGWDSSDLALQNHKPALDALTGGLLYVAATQYYAKLKDHFSAADQINKIKTPVSGFLGVVSSTYQPEYINGTAFSILPSGLLIDMKGITIGGSWRINAPATASNAQFNLIGHIASSLEHETWQELTGYDAISTVRGIQMALANGAALLDLKKNQSTDTMASGYAAFGFTNGAPPAGFTYAPFSLFGTQPATWTHASDGASFDTMLAQESSSTPIARQARANYLFSTTSGLYGWANCINNKLTWLNAQVANGWGNVSASIDFCDSVTHAGTVNNLIAQLQTFFLGTVVPSLGQEAFDYFDRAKGFNPANYVYRTAPAASPAHFTSRVAAVRNNLYLQDLTKNWVQYLMPSQQSVGPNFQFSVDVRNVFDTPTGNQVSATFEIVNQTGISAGGGIVMPPASSLPRSAAKVGGGLIDPVLAVE